MLVVVVSSVTICNLIAPLIYCVVQLLTSKKENYVSKAIVQVLPFKSLIGVQKSHLLKGISDKPDCAFENEKKC